MFQSILFSEEVRFFVRGWLSMNHWVGGRANTAVNMTLIGQEGEVTPPPPALPRHDITSSGGSCEGQRISYGNIPTANDLAVPPHSSHPQPTLMLLPALTTGLRTFLHKTSCSDYVYGPEPQNKTPNTRWFLH